MKPADRARVAQVTEAIIGLRAEIVVSIMRKHDTGTAEAQPLSAAQHLTLSVLRDEPLSVGDVAERTGVSASTTTRMLQGLKRKALIMDVAAPTGDRRHRYVTLTDSGREVADVRSRELVSRITQILGDLDHDEVLTASRVPFARALEMIRSGELEDAKSIAALHRAQAVLASAAG